MDETITCACGAASDLGDITQHVVTALGDATDTRDHTLSIPDPPQVAEVRAERVRLDGLRDQIETTTGMPATDLAAAIRGL